MTLVNITKLIETHNKRFNTGKKATHFTQLNYCKQRYHELVIVRGVEGGTKIPEDMVPRFLQWLSEDYNERMMNGESWQSILEELK